MPRRKQIIAGLEGVIQLAELRKDRPTVQLLDQITGRVRDAIELLRVPDSERKRLEFVCLALQQSTEIKVVPVRGRDMRRVSITDPDLYRWGIEQLHALALAA